MIHQAASWGLGALAALSIGGALAQQPDIYPSRLIRMIVPQPAGGTTDVLGRFVSQKIGTGTNEVLRNVVAKQVLGLPG